MNKKFLSLLLCTSAVLSTSCGKEVTQDSSITAPETTAAVTTTEDPAVTSTSTVTSTQTTAASSASTSSSETTTAAVTTTRETTAAPTTEAPTEAPTAKPTEPPTEPETEMPTEPVVLPDGVKLAGLEEVSVYDSVSVNKFLTEANVEILNGSDKLKTSKLGTFDITVKYSFEGENYEQKLYYKVVDNEPPLLLNAGWDPCHVVGTAFDLNDYVGFADNYDRHPKLTYDGKIDPNKTGKYPLRAHATDSSGNVTSWDVTISVVNSEPPYNDDRPRVKFGDFTAKYGGKGKRVGIDVSEWQGDIDWKAVKKAGCDFAMIRMGYYYSSVKMDRYYYNNIKNARDAGVDVGVYFYTTDHTEETVREHARWIAETLDGSELELPVAFDWEEFGSFQQYGMNIHDLNELYLDFQDELSKYGYKTMLYSSKNFLNNFWNEKAKGASPVWLAHYIGETDYTGDYWIWQQSSCGKISGIAGDVDMNVMYEKTGE